MKKIFFLVCFSLLTGCFQAYNEDAELRTVPITNNPTLIPNHGSSLVPGMGGAPY